jgi:cell division protein FtsN
MDWLRRNWPDLLIGIALVAVIATGGSFFSIGQPQTASTPSTPTATAPLTVAPDVAVPVVPEPDADAQPQVETPVVVVPDATADAADTPGPTVAVLPPSGNAALAADPPTADPVVETPAPTVVEAAPPPIVVDPPAPSADVEAPFRVSVGAFSTLENAQRQAQIFTDAGYPVLIGAQGDLSLVLVGPYALRADAERAASQIEAAGLVEEPLIYTFEPDDEPVGAGVDAGVVTAAAPTQTAPPVATVNQEGRFIQVGAYGSRESAEPQIAMMSGLGFVVDSRSEGGLVKLLIGPFAGDRLGEVQATLDAAGVAHFLR